MPSPRGSQVTPRTDAPTGISRNIQNQQQHRPICPPTSTDLSQSVAGITGDLQTLYLCVLTEWSEQFNHQTFECCGRLVDEAMLYTGDVYHQPCMQIP